uniref:Protein CASP n=1 Tax=Gongylonema pulchrum TaxID=637853 RepID=A0A183EIC0_9BILA
LITRLENDLLSLHAVLPRSRADGADADETDTGDYSTIKMLAQELAAPVAGEQLLLSDGKTSKDVLSIVSAQRDRLHHRVDELEQELSIQKQNNAYLRSERDKIREDNVQLYGKIKFLQSYQNKNREIPTAYEHLSSGQFPYKWLILMDDRDRDAPSYKTAHNPKPDYKVCL